MRRFASNFAALSATVTIAAMGLGGCGNGGEGPGGVGGDGGNGGNGGNGGTTACEGPEDCDDLNDCTEDACDLVEGTCRHMAVRDDTACSLDGAQGLCRSGSCEPAGLCAGVDCDDDNDCTIDTCNPVDGLCQHRAAPDDAPCDFDGMPGVCFKGRCEDAMLCLGVNCDDENECTLDSCDPQSGLCDHQAVGNGTPCADDRGSCEQGQCAAEFGCTEQGIRDAVELGGGPHTFDCNGPTEVTTEAVIWIGRDVILDGEGQLTVNGNGTHRIFFVREPHVALIDAELHGFKLTGGNGTGVVAGGNGGAILNAGTLTLIDTAVSQNTANDAGGGIFNGGTLMLFNCTVSENTSLGDGGGIHNHGTLTLTNSIVSGNTAASHGGGIHNYPIELDETTTLNNSTVSDNAAQEGGGIYHIGGRPLTLSGSTVSGNTAEDGAGLLNYQADVIMTNSTVSGNVAQNLGGAIFNRTQATLMIANSTVSSNEATMGNAIFFFQSGEVMLTNTIVDGDCSVAQVTSAGQNIESPGDTCGLTEASDQTSLTAMQLNLGALQDNGGLTLTQLPGSGSLAIDVIDAAECVDLIGQPVTSDQRGVSRPQGPQCDVGSVEVASTR